MRTPTAAQTAAPLDFETDACVLRGVWTGEDEGGHTLLLDATASDPENGGYTVTGTSQLDGAEPVVFAGSMRAAVTHPSETLRAQTSPVTAPFLAASVEGDGGSRAMHPRGHHHGSSCC